MINLRVFSSTQKQLARLKSEIAAIPDPPVIVAPILLVSVASGATLVSAPVGISASATLLPITWPTGATWLRFDVAVTATVTSTRSDIGIPSRMTIKSRVNLAPFQIGIPVQDGFYYLALIGSQVNVVGNTISGYVKDPGNLNLSVINDFVVTDVEGHITANSVSLTVNVLWTFMTGTPPF